MKIERICYKCNKIFTSQEYEVKRGGGKFCSLKCWYEYLKSLPSKIKYVTKICHTCNKEYQIPIWLNKRINNKYCSLKCKCTGEHNPNFKNRAIIKQCLFCGKEFKTGLHRIKANRGKFCSHKCAGTNQRLCCRKNKDTSIEQIMEKELTRRGIKFHKQYPIWQARTIPDFFIPPNICIYVDGEYWHSLPKAKIKDFNQNYWLEFLGYRVYRFWGKDIKKSIKRCVDKILV